MYDILGLHKNQKMVREKLQDLLEEKEYSQIYIHEVLGSTKKLKNLQDRVKDAKFETKDNSKQINLKDEVVY